MQAQSSPPNDPAQYQNYLPCCDDSKGNEENSANEWWWTTHATKVREGWVGSHPGWMQSRWQGTVIKLSGQRDWRLATLGLPDWPRPKSVRPVPIGWPERKAAGTCTSHKTPGNASAFWEDGTGSINCFPHGASMVTSGMLETFVYPPYVLVLGLNHFHAFLLSNPDMFRTFSNILP